MSEAAPGFRDAWSHRRWRRLLIGYAVSTTGDFLYTIALIVYVFEATGSTGWVAAAIVPRMLVYVVLSPVGGALADRFDRRRLLVSIDVASAALMGGLALIALAGGSPVLAITVAVVSSAVSTPYMPAATAATPLLVPEDDISAANAAESVVGQMGYLLGPALGAVLIGLSGPAPAFAVNGLTFLVSAFIIRGVGDIGGARGAGAEADSPASGLPERSARGVRAGVDVIRGQPGLLMLIVFIGASVVVYGFEEVAHVVIAEDRLGWDASAIGVFAAFTALGGLAGAPFTARLARSPSLHILLVAGGLLVGIPFALLATTRSPAVVLGLLVLEGVGIVLFEVLSMTLIQRACAEHVLGRVSGIVDSVAAGGQLVGAVAAPLLIEQAGVQVGLVTVGAIVASVSFAAAPSLRGLAAHTERQRNELRPLVDSLRSLDVFTGTPEAGLERVARQASRTHVPTDEVVIHEGDPPRDLYVVESGELAVRTAALGEVNRMSAGDVFGEIGLVRHMARTATVETTEPSELIVIPGSLFLRVVNGAGILPDALRRTISTRLGRTHPGLTDPE